VYKVGSFAICPADPCVRKQSSHKSLKFWATLKKHGRPEAAADRRKEAAAGVGNKDFGLKYI